MASAALRKLISNPRSNPMVGLRPVGQPAGSYVAGRLAECRNAIQLCGMCVNKFDAKRHNYIHAKRWGMCIGTCDGCRDVGRRDLTMFIHESFVSNMRGRIQSGQVYRP